MSFDNRTPHFDYFVEYMLVLNNHLETWLLFTAQHLINLVLRSKDEIYPNEALLIFVTYDVKYSSNYYIGPIIHV